MPEILGAGGVMANRLAGEGFDLDLRYGEAREDALVHVFLQSRVEVKSDRRAVETGNVFVEYRQKGRPSGLATTEASWWAFELVGLGWVLVETRRLRDLARRAFREGRVVRGGDYDRYNGVLLPVEWLVRDATVNSEQLVITGPGERRAAVPDLPGAPA